VSAPADLSEASLAAGVIAHRLLGLEKALTCYHFKKLLLAL
jgi:hypothetical protein